jgi:predicted component of type VI protein secretion system
MSELHQTLHDLHQELRQAQRLAPDDRALLETVMRDIQRVLEQPEGPASVERHGDTLEGAAVRLEAGHPGVAGAIRAVLDALGKAGI